MYAACQFRLAFDEIKSDHSGIESYQVNRANVVHFRKIKSDHSGIESASFRFVGRFFGTDKIRP